MIAKLIFILDKILQINSQVYLLAEIGKLATKMHKYLKIDHPENNRKLAQKLSEINQTISEATKSGDVSKIKEIVSSFGLPVPK